MGRFWSKDSGRSKRRTGEGIKRDAGVRARREKLPSKSAVSPALFEDLANSTFLPFFKSKSLSPKDIETVLNDLRKRDPFFDHVYIRGKKIRLIGESALSKAKITKKLRNLVMAVKAENGIDALPHLVGAGKRYGLKIEESDVELGRSYMIIEPRPIKAYDLFRRLTSAGYMGLCITSKSPKLLMKEYGVSPTKVIWLSESRQEGAIDPTRLDFEVTVEFYNFLDMKGKKVVIVDCPEYIHFINDLEATVDFMKTLVDNVSTSDAVLIASVEAEAMPHEAMAALETVFDEVRK